MLKIIYLTVIDILGLDMLMPFHQGTRNCGQLKKTNISNAIIRLLGLCTKCKYLKIKDIMYCQNKTVRSLLPIIANIFMEEFQQINLALSEYKLTIRWRYEDDTFVVFPLKI